MKIFAIYFLLLFFSFAASAEGKSMNKIQSLLSKYKTLKGEYTQKKHIKKMSLILKSNGNFEMSSKKIIWLQKKPIVGRYEISEKGVRQKIGDQTEEFISNKKKPESSIISDIVICIFNANYTCLNKNFKITNVDTSSNNTWKYTLSPKNTWLKKAMPVLKIKGNLTFVEEIQIIESYGDYTVINFSKVKGE